MAYAADDLSGASYEPYVVALARPLTRRVLSPGVRRAGGSDIHRAFVDLRDG